MSATVAAIVGGVTAVAGAVIQGNAAKSAAQTQANAQQQAIQTQQQMFQQEQANEQPFMQAGDTAAAQLTKLTGGQMTPQQILSMTPGYAFQQQMGMQGVLNGAAQGSGALAGSTQAALESMNQGLASQAFQNAFGDLYQVAGLGQSAAANLAQQGTALTGQTSQALSNIGSAQAAGQIGVANAASGALGAIGGIPMQMATLGSLNQRLGLNPNSGGAPTYYGPTGNIGPGLMDPYGNFTPWDS